MLLLTAALWVTLLVSVSTLVGGAVLDKELPVLETSLDLEKPFALETQTLFGKLQLLQEMARYNAEEIAKGNAPLYTEVLKDRISKWKTEAQKDLPGMRQLVQVQLIRGKVELEVLFTLIRSLKMPLSDTDAAGLERWQDSLQNKVHLYGNVETIDLVEANKDLESIQASVDRLVLKYGEEPLPKETADRFIDDVVYLIRYAKGGTVMLMYQNLVAAAQEINTLEKDAKASLLERYTALRFVTDLEQRDWAADLDGFLVRDVKQVTTLKQAIELRREALALMKPIMAYDMEHYLGHVKALKGRYGADWSAWKGTSPQDRPLDELFQLVVSRAPPGSALSELQSRRDKLKRQDTWNVRRMEAVNTRRRISSMLRTELAAKKAEAGLLSEVDAKAFKKEFDELSALVDKSAGDEPEQGLWRSDAWLPWSERAAGLSSKLFEVVRKRQEPKASLLARMDGLVKEYHRQLDTTVATYMKHPGKYVEWPGNVQEQVETLMKKVNAMRENLQACPMPSLGFLESNLKAINDMESKLTQGHVVPRELVEKEEYEKVLAAFNQRPKTFGVKEAKDLKEELDIAPFFFRPFAVTAKGVEAMADKYPTLALDPRTLDPPAEFLTVEQEIERCLAFLPNFIALWAYSCNMPYEQPPHRKHDVRVTENNRLFARLRTLMDQYRGITTRLKDLSKPYKRETAASALKEYSTLLDALYRDWDGFVPGLKETRRMRMSQDVRILQKRHKHTKDLYKNPDPDFEDRWTAVRSELRGLAALVDHYPSMYAKIEAKIARQRQPEPVDGGDTVAKLEKDAKALLTPSPAK